MKLNPREKTIAMAVGVILVVALVGNYLVAPYITNRQNFASKIEKATDQKKRDAELLNNRAAVDDQWKKHLAKNLTTQPAKAIGSINRTVSDWANASRFKVQNFTPGREVQVGDFQHVHFRIEGVGSTQSVSEFLRIVETTDQPVQIEKVEIGAPRENDSLKLVLDFNTLVYSPLPPKAPAKAPAPKGDAL